MSSPYIGEIRMFGGNFAPVGWAHCSGSLIPISENDALFTLIGTTYGGDGQETFALPDLQGRFPVHQGAGTDGITYQIGEKSGVETVPLSIQQMPNHTHPAYSASGPGNHRSPIGHGWAAPAAGGNGYAPTPAQPVNLPVQAGQSQYHENMSPFLVINFIISLYGVFPSQT